MFDIAEIKIQCEKMLCDTIKIEENNKNDTDNNDNNDSNIDVSDILCMLSLAERYSCNYLINKLMAYLKIQFILDNHNVDSCLDLSAYDLSDSIIDNIKKIYDDDFSI